ncbi:MAG: hypothetical protein QOG62_2563 [Thermoleophilaceae bacterium]|nr:hypothetical protein [Thermoleophilaceae bacterium]
MSDEWRVEVTVGDESGQVSMGEVLTAADLDSEAEERLGGEVIVTHDGPHLFLYSASEEGAREAERVAAGLIAENGLDGTTLVTRWHPDEQTWKDAAVPLPSTPEEREAEQERLEEAESIELATEGTYDWELRIELPGHAETVEFARTLRSEGLPVIRRWRYLRVGALTEQDARELAGRIRAEAPEGAVIRLDANLDFPSGALTNWLESRFQP